MQMAYPRTVDETDAEFGICCVGFMDVVLLAFMTALLAIVTDGQFTGPGVTLLLLHYIHVIVAVPGLLLYAAEWAYVGIYFVVGSSILAVLDSVIIVLWLLDILQTTAVLQFVYIGFHAGFWLTAVYGLLWAVRSFTDESYFELSHRQAAKESRGFF